ncbi:thiol reductant ABC exporter subunit CydC [Paenibacillus sediminis]|uniref:ATP-binding cassette subfamily C protein CydC n=1 Tax=Paenibacillus sediminis TaxID=664909 RepID=A0ABS4H2Q6_9BACL|nr:thiol reductant ABC exporter subunit CydC [Paenibacillus sediminis]MBP1936796.1 ATP-binding cassette subfamily C protein CydC [Paenibacillus sediminis]
MRQEGWIRPYFRTYVRRFLVIIALGILTVCCACLLMFTSGYLISKSALRPENILMVYVPIVLVRTFGISRAALHYVERLASHDMVLRILSQMRIRLYHLLEPQALFISSRFRTGDMLSMLSEDIEYLQNVYLRTVFPSIVALVISGLVIAGLDSFDVSFALLMALYLFVLVCILPAVSLWLTKKRTKQLKHKRNRLYTKLTDSILGMSDWMISGRASQFIRTYETDEQAAMDVERSMHRWASLRSFIAQCVVGVIVVSIVYWAGHQYADRHIESVMIAAFVLIVFPLMDAFVPMSEAIERIPHYQDSLNRLRTMDDAARQETIEDAYTEQIKDRSNIHIHLENVSYAYSDAAEPVLEDISLDIPQGKKIMIIGRSGAGKSTLLKCIQGAIPPSKGKVTMNGIDTHALVIQIPQIISVLNQKPHLFDTTVSNNIRLGKRSASDDEIRRAAEQVRLERLIATLPEGYKTPMHEAGQRFSGGERQRVALARILLQDTPVVILDEPTVGLDPRTEHELLATIIQTLAGKSLIWVTHHLAFAEHMDEIIFLEKGRIVMQGSHLELMKREPRYRRLYELDHPNFITG